MANGNDSGPRRNQPDAFPPLACITASLLLTALTARAAAPDEPITARDWCKGYANGLTVRFALPGDPTFQLYHDGPASPFIKYLDEMRTYGFRGIRPGSPGYSSFPPAYDEKLGKWRQPDEAISLAKTRVEAALARGYHVLFLPPGPSYASLSRLKKHEDRLTDQYIQRHVDVFEQYMEAFKDTSYRVAFQTNPEVHMWDYEMKKLPRDHPDHVDNAEFDRRMNAFYQKLTVAARRVSPKRIILYNHASLGKGTQLPFPFADDPPPTEEPVYYGIVENNFGPNAKGWQHWDCGETGKYSNEALRGAVTKRIEPALQFLAKNNLGFVCKNWASPYNDSPKPGQPNAEPEYKTITDEQSHLLASFIVSQFEKHGVCYEYADLRSERQLWDAESATPWIPPRVPNDRLLSMLLEKQSVRRLMLQTSSGGSITHSLGEPHKGINMVDIGSTVELKAVPEQGYVFTGWNGHVIGSTNPVRFVMPDDHGTIRANFARKGSSTGRLAEVTEPVRSWHVSEVKEYTYVDSSRPNKNFAEVENIFIKGYGENDTSDVKYAFMKFDVTAAPADRDTLAYATLKFLMHVYNGRSNAEVRLYWVDPDWDANKLTWASMPEEGELIGTAMYAARSHNNVEFDITDLVRAKGNGTYAFMATYVLPGYQSQRTGRSAEKHAERIAEYEKQIAKVEQELIQLLKREPEKKQGKRSKGEVEKEREQRRDWLREVNRLNDQKRKARDTIQRFSPGDLLIHSSKEHGNWKTQNKPLLYITLDTPTRITNHWKVITNGQ